MVEHFSKDLDALTRAMRERDADAILKIFADAKSARDAFAG
jgi:prephenate dehydrogenase